MRKLVTARLTLEPLTREHAPEMFTALADPAIYLYVDEAPPVSIEKLADRYSRLESRRSGDGTEYWLNWVARETATGNIAGYVQATVAGSRAFIAYVIAPSFQGKGFGREAAFAMIGELQYTYNVRQLRANVDLRNAASLALLRSLGFREIAGADAGDQLFELAIA